MANKLLPELVDAAKAAKENTAIAKHELATLRARFDASSVVTFADLHGAELAVSVAEVREGLAVEAMEKAANQWRQTELNHFGATASGELDQSDFRAALKRFAAAGRDVFRELARHNGRLDELAGELRTLAPFEEHHAVAFKPDGFQVNGRAFRSLDTERDVLPALRRAHRSALRGARCPF